MSVRVGLGIATNPFESARAFFRWVDLCERSNVDSLWQTDRLISSEPYLESLSTMAALAGATERMRFGMNAVVASLRDPLLLAKQCATIDYLSNGRLLPVFGVGADRAPEWEATNTSPKGRGRRADEVLELIRRLWTEDSVDFEGDFYQYRNARISPRPVQTTLPLWIGGSSAAAIRRTARVGTGWLAGIQTPEQVKPVVDAIRTAAQEAGRAIPEDHYGAGFPFRFGDSDDPLVARFLRPRKGLPGGRPNGYVAAGDAKTILGRIRAYRDAGVSKFVLIPIAQGDADLMDQTERLVREVIPAAEESQAA